MSVAIPTQNSQSTMMYASWLLHLAVSLGTLIFSTYLLKIIRFIYIYTRSSSIGLYCHGDGPAWALVTGASAGIGRALARELAHRGFNVVLHGRDGAKLEGVKNAIAKEYPERSFRIVIADASLVGQGMITQINAVVESIQDINLTILINNVGFTPPPGEPFYNLFENRSALNNDGWVALNVRFPIQLTCALLPTLLKRQPSLIITIGSMSDEGTPWLAIYSGCKAFLMSWSKALSREMKAEGRDIEILGIETGEVTANNYNSQPESFLVPNATRYAAAVLDRVGCGQVVVSGYWTQGMIREIARAWFPEWFFSYVLEKEVRKRVALESTESDALKRD